VETETCFHPGIFIFMNECVRPGFSQNVIMKSRFYGFCFHSASLSILQPALAGYRSEHLDANHIVYAFRWQEEEQLFEKFSDDGEPHGTAGFPLLGLLQKKDILNTALVVVRYFGGIKLGKKRLLSAYLSAGVDAAENALFKEKKTGYKVHLIVEYPDYSILENWLKQEDVILLEKNFSERIELGFWISQEGMDRLKAFIAGSCIVLHSMIKMDML
jgi:uncharacterized YigZ family protein